MARRASKSTTRLDLRKEAEAAEKLKSEEKPATKAKAKKKKAARKTTRRKTKKKVEAQRMRLVWGVFDNSSQQIAVFPYPERKDAEKKAEEMTAKGRGIYFVQPVKEPILEDLDD